MLMLKPQKEMMIPTILLMLAVMMPTVVLTMVMTLEMIQETTLMIVEMILKTHQLKNDDRNKHK